MRKSVRVAGLVSLLMMAAVWVGLEALPTPAQFELEGNIAVDASPADDWENTVPVKTATSEAIASTFVADGSGQATIFTTGGSKDINDISQWAWKDLAGGLPDKDNITNAYAAAYKNGSDLTFYFGADRFAQDGDAQFGFWFFKQQVQTVGGKFVGADGVTPATHAIGDVLVLVNLTNGGAVATAAAFRWIGGSNPLFPISVELDDAKCGENTDPDLCVISNPTPIPAPWAYQAKGQAAGTIPVFGFIEGGVNLKILGGGGDIGCFSSFLAETRSSQSVNATLKDFALGAFNTCKLAINKECPSATFDETTGLLTYTSNITVKNEGFGTVFDVTVTDTASGQPPVTLTLDSLDAGASHVFTHTFTQVPSPEMPNPPSNTAAVTAAVADGGAQIISAGPVSSTCPRVEFDAALSITKTCASTLEVQASKIVVAVSISGTVCNVPPTPGPGVPFPEAITGIVVNDVPAVDGQPLPIGTLKANECKDYASKYYPSVLTGGSVLAHDQVFEDTATATGTGAISHRERVNNATARCPLCF